jgi:site-specific DNA-methyltransferase (adenine-specific)
MKPIFRSHATVNWATPRDFYNALNYEFRFDYDPCPLHGKVGPLYGADGLHDSWEGKRVFCNPPYGADKIYAFMSKAQDAALAVFLVPARTDVAWFHEFAIKQAREIRFIRGRLKFGNAKDVAPFASMLVIFGE